MFDRLAFDWVGVLGTGGCRLYVVFKPHLNVFCITTTFATSQRKAAASESYAHY